MACMGGNAAAVEAALRDGASVNAVGSCGNGERRRPLLAAAMGEHASIVSTLLSRGANPNNDIVAVANSSTPSILLQLLDRGGDVNTCFLGEPLLFTVLSPFGSNPAGMVQVLLDQPALDLDVTAFSRSRWEPMQSPEQAARSAMLPKVAVMIEAEVGGSVGGCLSILCCLVWSVVVHCSCCWMGRLIGRGKLMVWCGGWLDGFIHACMYQRTYRARWTGARCAWIALVILASWDAEGVDRAVTSKRHR